MVSGHPDLAPLACDLPHFPFSLAIGNLVAGPGLAVKC